MKMTLSDALRWQKRVVVIIQKIEQAARASNSVQEGQTREFDVRKLLALRATWVNHLIELKLKKMDASRPIQEIIFALAETKTAIRFYEQLPTTHGLQQDRYGRMDDKPVKWIAEVRARERDAHIKKLQIQIDQMQKNIDTFNYTNSFDIEVPPEDEYSAAIDVPEDAEIVSQSEG